MSAYAIAKRITVRTTFDTWSALSADCAVSKSAPLRSHTAISVIAPAAVATPTPADSRSRWVEDRSRSPWRSRRVRYRTSSTAATTPAEAANRSALPVSAR